PTTYRRFYADLADTYKRANAAAADRGEISNTDPEVLAYCMLGVGHFMAMRYLLWDDEMPPAAEEAAIAFVQRGLRF
ncbi:MAG: TetR/AcrR family transcriptional regulator, partial [Candidatus Dormiibacterota bacterium]